MKKARKVAPAARRLGIESLERRELLAGIVAVTLQSGLLTVTGDNAANQITIFQQPNGRFNITGLNGEVFNGPTTNLPVRFINVFVNGGDDSVTISAQPDPLQPGVVIPAAVLGSVSVLGGAGSDTLNVSVIGRLVGAQAIPNLSVTIDGGYQLSGSQNDTVAVDNTATALLTVNTWGGIDFVDLNNVLTGITTINTGDGDDGVTMNAVTAFTATVTLGSSGNTVGNVLNVDTGLFGTLNVFGGNGIDTVGVANTLAGFSLSVYTYGGADEVLMDTVQTGLTPDDYVFLANQIIQAFGIDIAQLPFNLFAYIARLPGLPGILSIWTGEGDDFVGLNDVFSTYAIYTFLEGGNDGLIATNVDATYIFFNGGLGTDDRFLDNVAADLLSVLLFEGFLPDPNL